MARTVKSARPFGWQARTPKQSHKTGPRPVLNLNEALANEFFAELPAEEEMAEVVS